MPFDAAQPQTGRICRKAVAVERVVLEHHHGVEQLAQAGQALDLGKAQMLMRDQVRLAVLQFREQVE